MGRGGNDTLDPQALLYGRKPFRERPAPEQAEKSEGYFGEIRRLRAEQSPVFSTRFKDGSVAEASFSDFPEEDRSLLRIRQLNAEDEQELSVEISTPRECSEIKYLQRSEDGLFALWKATNGKIFSTTVFASGASISQLADVFGDAFSSDDGRICTARIVDDQLITHKQGEPIESMRVSPDSILVQGTGPDQGRVMVEGSAGYLWVVDMATGERLASIPRYGQVKKAAFMSNGEEFIVCYVNDEGLFAVSSSERSELMSSPLIDGEALFRGSLSPLARDSDNRVCLAWTEKDSSGRAEIYASRMTPDHEDELRGHLIETCESGIEVEAVTVVPGSGEIVWTQYVEREGQAAIRTSPMERSPGRMYIGNLRPGDRVWIDSVREDAGDGGELLWRLARADGSELELIKNNV